jgi:hypothetical protein
MPYESRPNGRPAAAKLLVTVHLVMCHEYKRRRFVMKRTLVIFTLVGLMIAGTVATASANWGARQFSSMVYTFGLEPVPGAQAHLWSNAGGVQMQLNTGDLMPGDAISVWWVIFNNPAACQNGIPNISQCGEPDLFIPAVQAEIHHADGGVIGPNGRGRFAARLYQGAVPRGWFGNGLIDPTGAEIHMVVRTHSQAISGRINDQVLTFAGACNNVPPEHPGYGDGTSGPNHCENIQFAVFQQN